MRSRAEPGSCSSLSSATSARPPSFLLNGRPEGPPRSERCMTPGSDQEPRFEHSESCTTAASTPGSRSGVDSGAAPLASCSTASVALFRSASVVGVSAATVCAPRPYTSARFWNAVTKPADTSSPLVIVGAGVACNRTAALAALADSPVYADTTVDCASVRLLPVVSGSVY